MTTETRRRSRRRSPQRRCFDQSVPSPCISVCTLDRQGICEGCFRSQDEIRDWMVMSREQKLTCLENVTRRMAKIVDDSTG